MTTGAQTPDFRPSKGLLYSVGVSVFARALAWCLVGVALVFFTLVLFRGSVEEQAGWFGALPYEALVAVVALQLIIRYLCC